MQEILIDAVSADTRLVTRGVKQAGFVVLKAPEIPSVLVETAFISNAREAAILRDPHFQTKFAEHLAQGIQSYKAMRIARPRRGRARRKLELVGHRSTPVYS